MTMFILIIIIIVIVLLIIVIIVIILLHSMLALRLLKSFNKVEVACFSLLFCKVSCLMTMVAWWWNVVVFVIWSSLVVWVYNVVARLVLAIIRWWRKRGRRSPFSLKVRMNVFNATQLELFTLASHRICSKFLMNRGWQDLRLLDVTVLFSRALFLAVRCNSKLVREFQTDLFVYRRLAAT